VLYSKDSGYFRVKYKQYGLFADGIYFLQGSFSEGTIMLIAVVPVLAISFYQEVKSEMYLEHSDNTLRNGSE
jgi:hypothetical protein